MKNDKRLFHELCPRCRCCSSLDRALVKVWEVTGLVPGPTLEFLLAVALAA